MTGQYNLFQNLVSWLFPEIFKIFLIVVLSFFLKNGIDIAFDKFVERAGENRKLLNIKQITHSLSSCIISTIAIIMILHQLGFDTSPLLAGASVIGVAFGLGLQHPMKDLITGFFILFEDHYVVGDKVKIEDISGTVEKITLRTTAIKDTEGNLHVISNGIIDKITVLKK